MPTYNYSCKICGASFEKFVHFKDDPDVVYCPNGHSQVRRVFSAPAIVFKGKGFYKTDSRPTRDTAGAD